jgi:membrane protein YqaA with SNARE-associated domain
MSPIKKIMKRGHVYHVYYRRLGAYRFIGQNSLKLLVTLIILGTVVYLFNEYVLNLSHLAGYITEHFNTPTVFASFFVSEVIFGLISPEFFMAWIATFSYKWLWLFLLAALSYLAGIVAYFIGTKLYHLPRIHSWVDVRFRKQFEQIKKFGGLLIVVAALTPLPFSPICMVAGVIDYSFKNFLLLTLSRIIRFAAYGAIIFGIV